MLELFPYAPRPHQARIVEAARGALLAGGHVVLESGTGTGKTVCALTAALSAARERGKRVLYLTRTNAQERQVVLEYRRIRGAGDGVAVALQGRTHLCPLRGEDEDVAAAGSEELGVMCRDRCRAADKMLAGERHDPAIAPCRFYVATRQTPGGDVAEWARREAPTAEELVGECGRRGVCPYVTSRSLLPEAELVAAPYVYLLDPFLRQAFLSWCGAAVSDFVVVVDEAHNLPDFARALASAELGERTLDLARREVEEHGDPTVLEGMPLSAFLETLRRVLGELAATYVPPGEEDALVPPEEVDAELIHAFRCATPRLDRALALLGEYGAAVREARRRRGRVPRSYVAAVAAFLQAWRKADESSFVRLVKLEARADRVEPEPRLECYAVDPSVVTAVLRDTAGSLHMSGTLAPLEEYRDSVGLPQATPLLAFPSPFPPENRLTLFDPDVTTRYEDLRKDPTHWDRIGDRLASLRAALPTRNMAVFLPSYEALHRLAPHVRGATVEVRGARQEELMAGLARFKASRGGTLLCVMGGKLSEGLDFPDEELEVVVVVGLPYPKPTARQAALMRFYDRRFGRGWDYAVRAPMTRKVLQSVGRLIRTPTDRGVAVLLDRRAALLADELASLRASRDAPGEARAFLDGRRSP